GERFQIGTSLQLPSQLRDRNASFQARLPSHPSFDNAEIQGDTMEMRVRIPYFARLGLRYFAPRFDVELAIVYEPWSSLENIEISPNDVELHGVPTIGSIPMQSQTLPQQFQNTVSIRLGGDYRLHESWTLRGGYIFEPTAVPDEGASVFAADATKHVFAVGGTRRFDRLSLDALLSYVHMMDRDISGSKVYQINPHDDDLRLVVGNGTYNSHYVLVGLGLNYRFD
ncbi:MAG: OmpP1/FadL family transporter, partial [Bradymonadaceae bacterium]